MTSTLNQVRTAHLRLLPALHPVTAHRASGLGVRLSEHAAAGRELCVLLGMTSDWAATRWVPTSRPGVVVPTFRIVVHSRTASRAELHRLADRLAKHGWNGVIPSCGETSRIEAARGDLRMRLVAHDATASLLLQGAPLDIGVPLAKALLNGIYEHEDIPA